MQELPKTRIVTLAIFASVAFFVLGIYLGYNQRSEIEKVTTLSGKETATAT